MYQMSIRSYIFHTLLRLVSQSSKSLEYEYELDHLILKNENIDSCFTKKKIVFFDYSSSPNIDWLNYFSVTTIL